MCQDSSRLLHMCRSAGWFHVWQASVQGEQLLGNLGLSVAWGDNYLPWMLWCTRPDGSVSLLWPLEQMGPRYRALNNSSSGDWEPGSMFSGRGQGVSRAAHLLETPGVITSADNPWHVVTILDSLCLCRPCLLHCFHSPLPLLEGPLWGIPWPSSG